MQLITALVLGLVQGITEFLPISSTAHLILFPWALGWTDPLIDSLEFDVALHVGTLVAVAVYFREDWLRLSRAFFTSVFRWSLKDPWERLVWLILAATVPAGVLGVLLKHYVETTLRSPLVIVFTLASVALLMLAAEKFALAVKEMDGMTMPGALIIGIAQAAALVPGVSRSGATITAGLFAGYRREAAARFSFLLSTPIIAGASLMEAKHLVSGFRFGQAAPLAVGIAASAVSGYLAIAFLIGYLKKRGLDVFAYYRLGLAGLILLVYLQRLPG